MKEGRRILSLVAKGSDQAKIRGIPSIKNVILRNLSYAIEVDFHTTDSAQARNELSAVAEIKEFRDITEDGMKYDEAYFQSLLAKEDEIINEARSMFSNERYWEAHTVLEDLWKASTGKRKKLLQGIIIVAAAMTHYQMEEFDVARRMYSKALSLISESLDLQVEDSGLPLEFRYPVAFPRIG